MLPFIHLGLLFKLYNIALNHLYFYVNKYTDLRSQKDCTLREKGSSRHLTLFAVNFLSNRNPEQVQYIHVSK